MKANIDVYKKNHDNNNNNKGSGWKRMRTGKGTECGRGL